MAGRIFMSPMIFLKEIISTSISKMEHLKNQLEKYIRELSMNSMGADIADINNDGYPEIYVTDMLPEDDARIKTKTNFENWDKYQSNLENGYYQQFVRNVLQLNNEVPKIPEIIAVFILVRSAAMRMLLQQTGAGVL